MVDPRTAHTGFSPGEASEITCLTTSSGEETSSGPIVPQQSVDKVQIIEIGGHPVAAPAPSASSWQNLRSGSGDRAVSSTKVSGERRRSEAVSAQSSCQSVRSSGTSSLQAEREVLRKKREVNLKLFEAQQAELELQEMMVAQQIAAGSSSVLSSRSRARRKEADA